MDYLTRALHALRPSSEFSFSNEDYSTINWIVLDGDAPTNKQVADKVAELQALDAQLLAEKAAQKDLILHRLGLTAEEFNLLVK